jgi:NADP-dependent alcohol dehydrogenase
MLAFRLCNPTEILFGQGQIEHLKSLVAPGTKVLLLYGGGSIKRNGVYDQVVAALAHCQVSEFGGIEPNPVYETILEAAALARSKGSELVLAVGGGSVVDAGKFLATIIPLRGADPWDHLVAGGTVEKVVPVGAVLTLAATGSESNAVSVISHRAKRLKLPFADERARPRFAILDPTVLASLDRRQLENGAVDAFVHVAEQYLTFPVNAPVHFGFSETLLETLIAWGPRLAAAPDDDSRQTVMWAANQALNGLIGAGLPQDWSTHMIGHAITALYGIDHARTLTLVMPSLLRYKRKEKHDMLLRYARRVWHVEEPNDDNAVAQAIDKTEAFFRTMGCPVRLGDVAPIRIAADDVVHHLEVAGQTALGERGDIKPADVRAILELAA